MRAAFGLVSVLLVLAIVSWTMRPGLPARPVAAANAAAAATSATPPALPAQVQQDVDAALREGTARNAAAERAAGASAEPQPSRANSAAGADGADR